MAAIVEISGQLESGLWDYNVLDLAGAHLPTVSVIPAATIQRNGFDAHEVTLSTLSGTYTETGAHLIAGVRTVDQVPIRELIRPARMMRLGRLEPRHLVTPAELTRADPGLRPGEALIIDTGWGGRWNQAGYVSDAPAFSVLTLEWLLRQPFSLLVLDTPVMECQWCASEGAEEHAGELLRPLYERGMILVAPVVNLERIRSSTGTLMAFPLPLKGVASAPGRVLFVEGESKCESVTIEEIVGSAVGEETQSCSGQKQ